RLHPDLKLDEAFSGWVLLSSAGFIFAFRRWIDYRRELKSRQEAEDRIRKMAMHDPLTGLANRRRMHEALAAALRSRKRDGQVTGFLTIDLDRFKPINDTHGHGVGDRLLTAVAERLEEVVRDGELVARMGGDEFAVLLTNADGPDAAGRPASRILKALIEPFQIDHLVCRIGASIGIATTNDPRMAADILMHRADVALYRAKREGRGQFRFFEETMDGEIRKRAQLELELRQALSENQITPYYQPLVELSNGRVRGYEVLARWNHPREGLIAPEVFIPIAEDTGLIGELSIRLLAQACLDARAWPSDVGLALNISPVQLRDTRLPEKLMAVMEATGFAPSRLEVEITENALVGDFDAAKLILVKLKSYGVTISLDDFGTGYSSLHHLRELPFDKLKIDRSFVASMYDSDDSRKIIDAIIGLGHSLGLTTIAEGIENPAAAARLAELGCAMGQGFLYGKAEPSGAAQQEEKPLQVGLRVA
ncbi:MAG: putative bifunctional diguanylate cyclase/phosphodiesterase, partial [Caulobacteraceae bacterium]